MNINKKEINITREIINIICMKRTSNNCERKSQCRVQTRPISNTKMPYPFIYYFIPSLTPMEYRVYIL